MATQFEFTAQSRTDLGKAATRRLRRLQQKIPAIVYGGDGTPSSITLDEIEVNKSLKHEAVYSQVLTLDLDGKKESVVLKAIQRHPAKSSVMHMDFMRIDKKHAITMRVPLHFIGEDTAPGVKQAGGIISHLLTEVEVKCLPKDLPEFIEVDISSLSIEQSLHLSDLKLPQGVILTVLAQGIEHDLPVVSIHKAKSHQTEDTSADGDAPKDNAENK